MGFQTRRKARQRAGHGPFGAMRAAGEQRDRAPVDRARGERAADGKLHPAGPCSRHSSTLDHLPRGVRASVAL